MNMIKFSLLYIIFLFPVTSLAQSPVGFVNDFADIIDDTSEYFIESAISELEENTSVEIAVVTVTNLPQDETVESYINKLFNEWGVGKKGEDNGIMILLSLEERVIRIEVGYGLEGILPDGKLGRILDDNLVALEEENYGAGLEGIVLDISQIIYEDYNPSIQSSGNNFLIYLIAGLIIAAVIGGFILVGFAIYNYNRCPKCRSYLNSSVVHSDKFSTRTQYVCPKCGYKTNYTRMNSPHGYPGGGHRSGGTFGGGSSGGGGAGRKF